VADRPRAVGKVWIVRNDPTVIGQRIIYPNRAFRRGSRKSARQPTPPAVYQPFTWAEHGHLLEGGVNL